MVALLEGRHKAQLDRTEEQRAQNHELAHLVAFAFHDPGKMPDYKPLAKKRQSEQLKEPTTSEADLVRARGYLIGLALRSGGG